MKTEMDTLQENDVLAEVIGERLAKGKRVTLKFEAPPITVTDGMVTNVKGDHVIQIDPELSPRDQLAVYLHEIAHVRIHNLEEVEKELDLPAKSIEYTVSEMRENGMAGTDHEKEADALAATWLQFADEHCQDAETDAINPRLMALIDWYETKFDQDVDEIFYKVMAEIRNREAAEKKGRK